MNGVKHVVKVNSNPKMLCTSYLNPADTVQAILAIIEAFPLPENRKYPLSLLCKAAWLLLLPRILPRLDFQPLQPIDAEVLNEAICHE